MIRLFLTHVAQLSNSQTTAYKARLPLDHKNLWFPERFKVLTGAGKIPLYANVY